MMDNTALTQLKRGILQNIRLEANPMRLVIVVERPDSEQPQTIEVYPGLIHSWQFDQTGLAMKMTPDLTLLSPDAPEPPAPAPQETEKVEKDWIDGG